MKKIPFAMLVCTSLFAFGAQAQNAAGPAKVGAFAKGSNVASLMPLMAKPPAAFEWAYPVAPVLPEPSPTATFTATGADPAMKLTAKQINNPFGPPDWFPKEHAPLPEIVAHGRAPHIFACALCHLPLGNGHPESASVSGLTVPYIIAQMHAFRDGDRTNSRAPNMIEMALEITEPELQEAAAYFSKIPKAQQQWIRVVETANAPANHVGEGGARFLDKGSKTVPLPATMIYEVAENDEESLRNAHVGFVDYVPAGSLAKGKAVATGDGGKVMACAACHGAEYHGVGDAPRLAGRSAYYLIRQLADMRNGVRKGSALGLMKDVVGKLSDADILNVAAYMASRKP